MISWGAEDGGGGSLATCAINDVFPAPNPRRRSGLWSPEAFYFPAMELNSMVKSSVCCAASSLTSIFAMRRARPSAPHHSRSGQDAKR